MRQAARECDVARSVSTYCAALALSAIASWSVAGSAVAREAFRVDGVVEGPSGRATSGVRVELVDADDMPLGIATVTDPSGRFVFRTPQSGTVFVRGTLEGVTVRALATPGGVRLSLPRALSQATGDAYSAETTQPQNPLATTLEDFEDGSAADYTTLGTITGGVSGASAHNGGFGLGVSEQTFPGWLYRSQNLISQGQTVSAWIKPGTAGRAYVGFGSNATGTFALAAGVNTNTFVLQYIVYNSPHESFAEMPFVWISGRWYLLRAQWGAGGSVTGTVFDSDGATVLATASGSSTTYGGVTQGGNAWRGFGDIQRFDTLSEGVPTGVPVLDSAGQVALLALLSAMGLMTFGSVFRGRRGEPSADLGPSSGGRSTRASR